MASPSWQNYSDESGWPARVAHRVSDPGYFTMLVISVALAVPPVVSDDLLWVGALSVAVAAFAAAGLALKARPRRYVKSWADLAWDGEVAALPGFEYLSEDDGAWLITVSQHRKGPFPSVRILERESDQGHWREVLSDIAINPKGDITLTFGMTRSKEDDGPKFMVVVA